MPGSSRKDYLDRQLEGVARLLARLLGLRDAGHVDEARKELDLKHEEGATRPRGAQLHFLHFHEAYHAGQLGLLRRMAGKDGAI